MNGEIAVFCGNANPKLAEDICQNLRIPLGQSIVSRFSDGEIKVKIEENVRGKDVFVIQSTCPPSNDNLMELLILIDALKRASARRITAVTPHYGYARQDRKDQPRVPITAKLVADLIATAGANRLLTMDLHAEQIQGFFNIPVDNLYAVNIFVKYFSKMKITDLCVVSPDVGGIKMARAYAKRLGAELAIVDKRRVSDKEAEVMHIIGKVRDKNIVIVDDVVSTAGTLTEGIIALKERGARDVYAAITHPVLAEPAIERINGSKLKELLVTDTIAIDKDKKCDRINVLSVAPLFAEAITRIHREESVSALFV
ncbi:MAG: ribose-phosphate pyrophosphokinase [Candidatus Omnitrophica bacterium]|nr:ribose-phosphate pyrophosphokinase [Candidatus Omnitrophota bacterium]